MADGLDKGSLQHCFLGTVSAVTWEAVADLDGTENAARRAEDYRSVVLNRVLD